MVLADISLKETDGSTATFNVTSGVGKGIGGSWFSDFGENDYWKWGLSYDNMGGYCDGPYSGTNKDSDAAEEIEKKIDHRISLPVGHSYFTDISEVYLDVMNNDIVLDPNEPDPVLCECCDLINPNDLISNDNMYDYLLFKSKSIYNNHHDCLDPDEMNFYLDGMEELIYNIVYDCFETELEDKIFSSSEMIGNYYMPPNEMIYFHEAYIYYGISNGSGNPPPR